MTAALRIQRAALRLKDFTAADLSAHSGVTLATVRSELRRDEAAADASVFVRVGDVANQTRGRRPVLYALRDAEALAARLPAPSTDDAAVRLADLDSGLESHSPLADAADSALAEALRTTGRRRDDALSEAREASLPLLDGNTPDRFRERAISVLVSIESLMATASLQSEFSQLRRDLVAANVPPSKQVVRRLNRLQVSDGGGLRIVVTNADLGRSSDSEQRAAAIADDDEDLPITLVGRR